MTRRKQSISYTKMARRILPIKSSILIPASQNTMCEKVNTELPNITDTISECDNVTLGDSITYGDKNKYVIATGIGHTLGKGVKLCTISGKNHLVDANIIGSMVLGQDGHITTHGSLIQSTKFVGDSGTGKAQKINVQLTTLVDDGGKASLRNGSDPNIASAHRLVIPIKGAVLLATLDLVFSSATAWATASARAVIKTDHDGFVHVASEPELKYDANTFTKPITVTAHTDEVQCVSFRVTNSEGNGTVSVLSDLTFISLGR